MTGTTQTTEGPANGPYLLPSGTSWGPHDHATLAEARRRHWYARSSLGMPLLLRHRDCAQLMKDEQRFRTPGVQYLEYSGITGGPAYDWAAKLMFNNSAGTHRKLRSLANKALRSARVESLRPEVGAAVDDICTRVEGDGEFDVVQELAARIPVLARCRLMGIARDDADAFESWATKMMLVFSFAITPEERAELEAAVTSFSGFIADAIQRRRERRYDDLVWELVNADEERVLDDAELAATIGNIVIGGQGTTTFLIANGVHSLLRNRDQWERLVADPDLAAGAVEETLRCEPPTPVTFRVAREDVVWEDLELPAGTTVGAHLMAANRDPELVEDPDRFDIGRESIRHISFGGGAHYCIGAALGRLAAQECFEGLARRFPSLEIVEEGVRWSKFGSFRGLSAVTVRTT